MLTPERIRELWFIAWDRYKIVPVQAYDFACAIERAKDIVAKRREKKSGSSTD